MQEVSRYLINYSFENLVSIWFSSFFRNVTVISDISRKFNRITNDMTVFISTSIIAWICRDKGSQLNRADKAVEI